MTFTSLTFIAFLVLVFGSYWSLRSRAGQNTLLAAASFVFYGWWDWRFCGLMILSATCDFALALLLSRARTPATRRLLLVASCVANLSLLGFFKYFNFFQDSLIVLCDRLGWQLRPLTLRIVLPIGISFYTFQSMSYIIDVYRGALRPTTSLRDYLAFVSFFPQLVAGPIERAVNLLPQFQTPRIFDPREAAEGCRRILWGFVKKMALADNLAAFVDVAYADPASFTGLHLLRATVFFAFQIYCDFSAYSDIALGTAQLFGFRLMRNFATPYFSLDLAEFWRRWHISLSTWFRDYLYFPLGGSRVGRVALARNVLITFALSGLWHGASWNFVIWGLIHGGGVVACTLWPGPPSRTKDDLPGGPGWFPRPAVLGRMALTFLLVCLGWVFFRAATLPDAVAILKAIFTRPFSAPMPAPHPALPLGSVTAGLLLLAFIAVEWFQRDRPHGLTIPFLPRPLRWAVYTVLLWGTMYLHLGPTIQFIYFQF